MAESFGTSVFLGHLDELGDGSRVRLRLARGSDLPHIRELLRREGLVLDPAALARLVHFDPRRRYVVCATGLVDSTETLLGIGAIAFEADRPEPDLVIVVERYRDELSPLLTRALVAAAGAMRRPRAA